MTTIVTGWTGRGYDRLGEQFAASFDKHWPRDVRLAMVVDDDYRIGPLPGRTPRIVPLSECEGLAEFVFRHGNDRAARGRVPDERWKEKERVAGYSYRFDAVKFAPQMFMPEAVARTLPDGEILAWFDADVVTFRPVPPAFVETIIGDCELAYLGRDGKHSEIGFYAVRLNAWTRWFLSALAGMYRRDKVFRLAETHSAFVFDHCRIEFERQRCGVRNLTPGGRGHVWFQSELGRCTDHLKGKRKQAGRSRERRG